MGSAFQLEEMEGHEELGAGKRGQAKICPNCKCQHRGSDAYCRACMSSTGGMAGLSPKSSIIGYKPKRGFY